VDGVDLKLYFGAHLVGTVSDTHYSDFNWYGTLRPADDMPARIREFIALCRDWHARSDAGQPHDPDEFNPWRDVHDPGEWRTAAPDGSVKRIRAPVFWPDGYICWREAKDAEPGAAAGQPRD
jgi:hypothetical protein